jgi:hypothetical protein
MAIIDKPSDYFNTVLYTGNGSTNAITGVGFQPDWVWIKNRAEARDHKLTDVVRGVTKALRTNSTIAEETDATGLTAFGTDGFTLGSTSGYNNNSETFASWNWLANGAGSANTDGSISSTVSANTTAGFSIVKYTGTEDNATVGHGLGVTPNMIITKKYSAGSAQSWECYHSSLAETQTIRLNSTNALRTSADYQSTRPTSSVFSLGAYSGINASGATMISYCFAEKQGFSKFGGYVGNGDADGTFVYTGFKPAFVIFKNSTGGNNWNMRDNKRNTYNPTNKNLYPNNSNAEDTDVSIDFVSNGFKLRDSADTWNGSGDTYIYMAFAENPFVTSTGVPATAR